MGSRIRGQSLSDTDSLGLEYINLADMPLVGNMKPVSDLESEITDVDSEPHSFIDIKSTSIHTLIGRGAAKSKNGVPVLSSSEEMMPSTDLNLILSGKQSKVKNRNQECKIVTPIQPDDVTESEISDNLDSSFTELKSAVYRRDHDLIQLEKKFFPDAKSISSKDLFMKLRQEPRVPEVKPVPIVISDDEDSYKKQEDKIYGNQAKRIFTKDLLRPITKKKQKLVCFKISPSVLREIKLNDNPFKVKGNGNGKSSGNSIFKTMMNNQNNNSIKKTPLQKLKELDLPVLNFRHFHIYDQLTYIHSSGRLSSLPRRSTQKHNISELFKFTPKFEQSYRTQFPVLNSNSDLLSLINLKIPNWQSYPQLTSIVDRFIIKQQEKSSQLWIDLFKPESTSGLMMADENVIRIKNWINNCYGLLKSHSKEPRNILLQQRRKKISNKNNLSGFIVDDSIDSSIFEDSDTEEDIFMPLLLIQGSTGSCKSTAVYSAMNAHNGYVFEINTGINRGRKDIYNSLKEFCTTQLVHKQNESKTFQKGLVLLEDVDILFEQDKSFWLVVQDILNISRRPIVLTCEDFRGIPKSILDHANEEDSIVRLDKNQVPKNLVFDYLWICALVQGFIIPDCLLNDIISLSYNGRNYDLRKCLMECQMACQVSQVLNLGATIKVKEFSNSKVSEPEDLLSATKRLENLSSADVIKTNTISSLNHETISNEFVDIYMVDESTKLKQATLSYELNIGDYIYESINGKFRDLDESKPKFTYNQMKEEVLNFIGSRSKKAPKFIQDMLPIRRSTRSQIPFDESMELNYSNLSSVGIPDTSFLNYMTPTSYALDILPYVQEWLEHQKFLNHSEESHLINGTPFFKPLGYRDFQDVSLDIIKYLPQY